MIAPGWRPLGVLGALCLVLTACAGPVGTNRSDPKVVLRDLARSATTTGEPSWQTRDVLLERGLFDEFDERPEEAIAALHRAMVATGGDPDLLFALAELSFLHGQTAAKPSYQLAAAVYAWAFLFPEGSGAAPGRFDPRLRIAADLYNWSLTAALRVGGRDGGGAARRHVRAAVREIDVAFDPAELRAGDRELLPVHPGRASSRWRDSRCAIAGRASALRSRPRQPAVDARSPAATWWRRACRCR